jgi:thymidine phosphorylase
MLADRTIAVLRALSAGQSLAAQDAEHLLSAGNECQLAAAAAAVQRTADTPETDAFLLAAAQRSPMIRTCLGSSAAALEQSLEPSVQRIVHGTGKRSTVGRNSFKFFINLLLSGTLSPAVAAFWLMAVCRDGLSNEDVGALTHAMVETGCTYDYRKERDFREQRFVRRYPTGALSEKASLIVPALLVAAANDLPVASPFLVARSLGFTGGTWDKLSAIPGFTFPSPGDDTLRTLKACGVAMTVAQNDLCPGDRLLYELRSATSTIEAPELIVSSIASKQLAVPVDCLLLDVRFGAGAFMRTHEVATAVATQIVQIVGAAGTDCPCLLTDTIRPGGAAIGNALEVCEALAVMGRRGTLPWDERALADQIEKVATFFSALMERAFPGRTEDWRTAAKAKLRSGEVLKGFAKLLITHGVADDVATELLQDPAACLLPDNTPVYLRASMSGEVAPFDQHLLGELCLSGCFSTPPYVGG